MAKDFNFEKKAGSQEADEPSWHRNTDLGCDVKTILRSDQQMKTGKGYRGVLCRDAEAVADEFLCRDAHYVFIETATPSATKRNPQVFDGRYITVTRRDDGSLRPNFKPMPTAARLSVDNYAFEVYRELRGALKGLIVSEGHRCFSCFSFSLVSEFQLCSKSSFLVSITI